MSKLKLLKNYCHIVQELESIKNRVIILRNATTCEMNNTKSKKTKKLIYKGFEEKLDQIKNETYNRYTYLKTEKIKLERELSSLDKSINNNFVRELKLINVFSTTESKNIGNNINLMISRYTTPSSKNYQHPINYSDVSNNQNRIIKLPVHIKNN